MELTRDALADELEHQLRQGVRGKILAIWAHRMYLDHSSLEPGVYDAIMTIVAAEEGEEFALADSDLAAIVEELRKRR
jgi:hypothetical protein